MDIFERVPVLGRLARQSRDMISMVKDYLSGEYKRVPYAIPVVGYLDDVAVMEFVGKSIEDDLEENKVWKSGEQ